MTNSPRLDKSLLHSAQGHRIGLANGHCLYDLDVSRAPEEDIKSQTRIEQERANGPKQPISPRGSGDSDFVKVESPPQHSPESLPERLSSSPSSGEKLPMENRIETPQQVETSSNQPAAALTSGQIREQTSRSLSFGGRQAGQWRRQQQASRSQSLQGAQGRQGMHNMPQAAHYMPGSQYGQAHQADCGGGQSVAMVAYGTAAQTYNQGGVLPQGVYPSQQYNPYIMHHPPVMWANQYDSSANPQGSMHQPPPPVSAPVMPYYSPQTEYIGYYSQLPPMSHEGAMYFTYSGAYEGFVHPMFNAPVSHRRSSQDRGVRQPPQALQSPATSLSSMHAQQGMKPSASAPIGDFPRGKSANRRQNSVPSRADITREPRGHRRQSSMPGYSMTDRDFSNTPVPSRGTGHRRLNSSPAEVHEFRPPRKVQELMAAAKGKGHRRHFSLPGNVDSSRLQVQKNGEGGVGARRHRRVHSEDSSILHQEASTLEAIKSNRGNSYKLKDIAGNVCELCKDQFGSRFIQTKIDGANAEEVAAAFGELCSAMDLTEPNTSLMNDVFGNYVVQKFLDRGTDEQKTRMARIIQGNVKMLSLQVYGCRVIQKAIEVLSLPEKIKIVEELKGHVIECINDQNGNHVIQKCIECIPSGPIEHLLKEMAGSGGSAVALHRAMLPPNKSSLAPGFVNLSRHPYGCRVVQRILEKCTLNDYKHSLVVEVTENALDLSRDTYGNYVIQHSLAHGDDEEREEIIRRLQDHIVELSTHKFASNVVEKCLQHGSHAQRRKLISTMLGEQSGLNQTDADHLLQTMTKDQYGNYVVQKTLEKISMEDLFLLRPYTEQLEFEKINECPIERLFIAKLLGIDFKNPYLVRLLDMKCWVCTDVERDVLLAKIKEFLTILKKQQYGKHIVMRIEKLLNNAATWVAQRAASQAQIATAEVGPPMDVQGAFQQLSITPGTAASSGVPAA